MLWALSSISDPAIHGHPDGELFATVYRFINTPPPQAHYLETQLVDHAHCDNNPQGRARPSVERHLRYASKSVPVLNPRLSVYRRTTRFLLPFASYPYVLSIAEIEI